MFQAFSLVLRYIHILESVSKCQSNKLSYIIRNIQVFLDRCFSRFDKHILTKIVHYYVSADLSLRSQLLES